MAKRFIKCDGYDDKLGQDCLNNATHIHHKDFDHNNNNIDNIVHLCPGCHRKEHAIYEDDFGNLTHDSYKEIDNYNYNRRLFEGYSLLKDD